MESVAVCNRIFYEFGAWSSFLKETWPPKKGFQTYSTHRWLEILVATAKVISNKYGWESSANFVSKWGIHLIEIDLAMSGNTHAPHPMFHGTILLRVFVRNTGLSILRLADLRFQALNPKDNIINIYHMGVSYGSHPKWMVFSMDNPWTPSSLAPVQPAQSRSLVAEFACYPAGWRRGSFPSRQMGKGRTRMFKMVHDR